MFIETIKEVSHADLRIVQVDEDTSLYEQGHIPGAIGWSRQKELQDPLRRDILSKEDFEKLMSDSGISRDTTVILYGDNNNWFAAYAFWQMKIYNHQDVRLMDGGRKKWVEDKRPLTLELPQYPASDYEAPDPDLSIRANREDVMKALKELDRVVLIDARSEDEFSGKLLAPAGLPGTAQRAGHIPGAQNVPWDQTVNNGGTFKSAEELHEIYGRKGVNRDTPVITYCRIGERSAHSWFALKYLLGVSDVSNYDGSWTEWGNLVGAAVHRNV